MSTNITTVALDVGDNARALLEQLAAKLGMSVEKIWPWLVRQSVLEGITFVTIYSVVTLSSLILLCLAFKKGKWSESNGGGPENGWAVGQIIFSLLFAVCVLVGCIGLGGNIQKIMNPEYYALRELFALIKK